MWTVPAGKGNIRMNFGSMVELVSRACVAANASGGFAWPADRRTIVRNANGRSEIPRTRNQELESELVALKAASELVLIFLAIIQKKIMT